MVLPPHSCWSSQLMCSILSFQYLSHPQHTEFIFHSVDLFFSIEWFCGFLEYWRPGVHKIFKAAILIHPIATTLIVTMLNIVGDGTQKILHVLLGLFRVALTPEQLCKEHLWGKRGGGGKCGSWGGSLLLPWFPPPPPVPAPLAPGSAASYVVRQVFVICIFQQQVMIE